MNWQLPPIRYYSDPEPPPSKTALFVAVSGIAAVAFLLACWWGALFPPTTPPCSWRLDFQNGTEQTVYCDHITTSPDVTLAGYFTVTAYDNADRVVGTFTWVCRARASKGCK